MVASSGPERSSSVRCASASLRRIARPAGVSRIQTSRLSSGARMSRDGAGLLQPVDQFDGAVMLNEQTRGDLADGRLYVLGKAMHGQQQLMLLRFDAVFFRGGFAEMEELPDLPPELGQIAVLLSRKILCASIFISYHDINPSAGTALSRSESQIRVTASVLLSLHILCTPRRFHAAARFSSDMLVRDTEIERMLPALIQKLCPVAAATATGRSSA